MKKQKLPKYIQEKFKKAQFKVGDKVKYEFLGDDGWGIITKIQKFNETVSYMVKTRNYSYPCGLQIKEFSSYYAGSIDYEASKNQRNDESSRRTKNTQRNDSETRKRISRSSSNTISNTKIRHRSKNDSRNGNGDNSKTDETSTATIKNIELEDAISKQQSFLRKFT